MNYTLEIALDYLRHGLSIIPLQPNGKEPNATLLPTRKDGKGNVILGSTGKPLKTWQTFVDCHASVEEVRQWFYKVPHANIGILTGKTSRIIVLDIDGPEGEEFIAGQGKLPLTPTARTNRGRHVYFRHPGFKVRNFVHRLPELDMRGDGGYVCAYPSIHPSGSQYMWEIGLSTPFAAAPEWLLRILEGQNRRTADKPPLISAASAVTHPTAYGAKALLSEQQGVINTTANRNDRLYLAALKMGSLIADGQLDRTTVEQALLIAAAACGLSADDGETASYRTIVSGINKGMESPRGSYKRKA